LAGYGYSQTPIPGPGTYTTTTADFNMPLNCQQSAFGSMSAFYTFTPTACGTIDVASCNNGTDTSLGISSTIACPNVNSTTAFPPMTSCATNDDACATGGGATSNFASQLTGIPVIAGVTYEIEWGDRWDNADFDWTLDFTPDAACTPVEGNGTVMVASDGALGLDICWAGCGTSYTITACPVGVAPGGASCVTFAGIPSTGPVNDFNTGPLGGAPGDEYEVYITTIGALGACGGTAPAASPVAISAPLACGGATVPTNVQFQDWEGTSPNASIWTFTGNNWTVGTAPPASFNVGPPGGANGTPTYVHSDASDPTIGNAMTTTVKLIGAYGAAELSFFYHAWIQTAGSTQTIEIQVTDLTNGGTTTVSTITTQPLPAGVATARLAPYQFSIVNLSAFVGSVIQVDFVVTADVGFAADIAFDELSFDACTQCDGPMAPTFTCPPDITVSNTPGLCEALVDVGDILPTDIMDDCPITVPNICISNSFSNVMTGSGADGTYPVGTTPVEWTVTDVNGNSTTCITLVTVEDDEAPVFTSCPDNITVNLDGGDCSGNATFTVAGMDNCPSFVAGTGAPVELADNTAANNGGAANWSILFDVANNSTAPISIVEFMELLDAAGTGTCSVYTTPGTAAGNELNAAAWTLVSTGPLGGTGAGLQSIPLMTPIVLAPGQSIGVAINCTGAGPDYYNGTGGACAPVTNGDVTITGIASSSALFAGAVFSPRCFIGSVLYLESTTQATIANGGVVQTAGLASGSEFPIGTTTNTFTITDAAGNVSTCEFDVIVNGVANPVTALACNDQINISVDENCQAFIGADLFLEGGPYACYDECYEVVLSSDPTTPLLGGQLVPLSPGTYTATVTDICDPENNSCWSTFVVEDKLSPTIECEDLFVTCLSSDIPEILIQDPVLPIQLAPAGFEIMDNTSTTFEIPVSAACTIEDINVKIDIEHTWIGDLNIVLTTPAGTSHSLWGGFCGPTANLDFIVDEEGTNSGACADYQTGGNNLFLAGFVPATPFASAYGTPASGTWTLTIADNAAGDPGVVNEVSLILNENSPDCALVATGFSVSDYLAAQSPFGCGAIDVYFDDLPLQGDECAGAVQIQRVYTATDAAGNSGTCEQIINVNRIGLDGLDGTWFWPDANVDLTCGADTSPEAIYERCRAIWMAENPMLPSVDPDEYAANANSVGVSCAFPYYFNDRGFGPLKENFIDNACNLFFTYSDQVIEACGVGCAGNSKVLRTWTALDWCTGTTSDLYVQVLNAKDTEAPEIDLVDEITVSASPWGCAASFILPVPEHLRDNCSEDVTYTVYGAPGTSTSEDASPVFENGQWRVYGLPKSMEPATYIYAAEDCCGNITNEVLLVTVIDATAPVATATQNIVINLTASPSDPDGGVAKLYATSVDNGSHDGDCGPVRLAVRRTDAETQTAAQGGNINDCGSEGLVYNTMGDRHNNNATFFAQRNAAGAILGDNMQPGNHDQHDDDEGDYVKFCCSDLFAGSGVDVDGDGMPDYALIEVELGVWDDANMDGIPGNQGDQFSLTWATVRVEAKFGATISCPPTAKITCEMDETDLTLTGGAAFAGSTCADLNTVYVDYCGLDVNNDQQIGGFVGNSTVNEVGMCYDVNGDGVIANYTANGFVGEDFFNKACHYGPITRWWSIEGTSVRCKQVIILSEPTTTFVGNGLDLNNDGRCDGPGEICPVIDWPYSRNAFINIARNDGSADCDGDGRGNEIAAADIILVPDPRDEYPDYAEVGMDCIDALCEEPVWVDANCSLVGWSLDSDTFFFEGDACRKIINTYTVIDWCQYDPNSIDSEGIWTWTVIGKLLDPYPPMVTAGNDMFPAVPGGSGSANPTNGSCVGFATAKATAFDTTLDEDGEVIANACPSQWLKWNVYVDIGADWVFDREWSSFVAPDLNTTIDPLWSEDNADDNLAVYGYLIPDVRVGNGFGVDNAVDFATEPGFEYMINIPDAIPADCGETQHRVVWKVYDGCGNVTSTESFFTVQDLKAPTPYCVNLSTALMADPDGAGPEVSNVELWAIDFDFGSFDNCTAYEDLRYTFTDVAPENDPDYIPSRRSSARAFTCDDLAGSNNAVITVPVYVWDGCNNFDFCLVNLRLIDNNPDGCTDTTGTGSIAGKIITEFGETVEEVDVTNADMMDQYEMNDMTDDIGSYAFNFNTMGNDFQVTPTKNDDYLNGVSTLDIIIIQRHILNSVQLDSPYKMIAADVNNDGSITALDLIELRKLILGIYDELPANSSWRFVDASTTVDMSNPFDFKEEIDIYNLTVDRMDEDFVGVKIGDVNQSVVANLASTSTESRSAATIDVTYADRNVVVGEVVEIVVSGQSMSDLYGYQFTLGTSGLELMDVQSGMIEVSNANFGALGNKVSTSWNSLTPINGDGDLFTMTFKSTTSGLLSEILDLNSSVTRAEAYVGENLDIVNIDLSNGTTATGDYALYQNEPNPFTDRTTIGFELPNAGAATLTVLDVTGKVLSVREGNYAKGYNELELSKSDFGTAGVFYYQLDSGDFTATKKMIIIE